MIQQMLQVNWLALVACAVASMVVGFIWYGPIFSRQWGELTGWTAEKVQAEPQSRLMQSYGMALVIAFVMAFFLSNVLRLAAVEGIASGLFIALVTWLGFVATSIGVNYTFQRRPLMLFVIEAGYHLVAMLVFSIILTLWR
jgi:uncharacterized protein YacL